MDMVLQFLRKAIRQASKAAISHPQIEILALHETSRDMGLIGTANDFDALGAKTLRGAVAFLSLRIVAVDLHQLINGNWVPIAN